MAGVEDLMSYHIAILFHEADRSVVNIRHYAISALAEFWRRDGHTVTNLFGIRKFIPADLILVHVDLSVVPDEYITFAEQYPIVLNSKAKDIRKSTFSKHLLRQNDNHTGQAFIKSNLNSAGIPEAFRLKKGFFYQSPAGYYIVRGMEVLLRAMNYRFFRTPSDYLVVNSLREVPFKWFQRNDIVIQRFFPEFEGGLYHVRLYQFLGNRYTCSRISSPQPVVNDRSSVRCEPVEVHPEIERMRHEFKFDYGKFDYVMHQGAPVLLDINKTTGAARKVTLELEAMRKHRAEGLYSYFR